ncbi:MAG TPA: AI-2E family transporter [Terriglobia bacterium]|nr:AI-2E family transporter [Terriglobia bacterium]
MPRGDYGRISILIILVVVVYLTVRILEPFIVALLWAVVLATVFYPVFNRLSHQIHRPRLASIVTCLLLTVLIMIPLLIFLVVLANESVNAYRMLDARLKAGGLESIRALPKSGHYQWLLGKMQALGLGAPDLSSVAVRAVQVVSTFLVSNSTRVLSGFTSFIFNALLMLFALYYFLLRGPAILDAFRELVGLSPEYMERITGKFKGIAVASFGGALLTAALQGVLGGIIFFIFGLSSPLLWGAMMGLLSLVPVVGTALIWVPVTVYYFLSGSYVRGLIFLTVCAAGVGSVDNIVKPYVMRRGVEIDTLWIFLSIMGGIGVFGILGFILGPFIFTLLLVMIDIFKAEFRKDLTPGPTS